MKKQCNDEYMHSQAQRVHVPENDATREFLEARRDQRDWVDYKGICHMRHEWGMYLRSNLDWDWDTTGCLERLFELPEEAIAPTVPIATVSLDAGRSDTWNIATDASMPMKIKIPYKSALGKTKYRTFVSCPSSEDVASTGELSHVVGEQYGFSLIRPEVRCAGGDVVDGSGLGSHDTYNAAPMPETGSELGAKQFANEQKVLLIPEEPSYAGHGENRAGSEVVVHEDSDAPPDRGTELEPMDDGYGDQLTDKDCREELMRQREVFQEQHTDQISICSLD